MYRTITSAAILCTSLGLFAAVADGQRRDDANGQPVQSTDQLPNNLPGSQPATIVEPTVEPAVTQAPYGQPEFIPQQQENRTTASQQSSARNQAAQPGNRRDYFLASWIGADNYTEIQVNQYALQHTSNQEVKDFAQEMIRMHTDLANKINQAVAAENRSTAGTNRKQYTAGYRGVPTSSNITKNTSRAAGSTREENATGQNTSTGGAQASNQPNGQNNETANEQADGRQNGATFQHNSGQWSGQMTAITVKRQINNQLVRLIEQKLGEKKGEDFDRCFMAGQVAAHMQLLATLDVARNEVSPQLKKVLDDAVGVAQNHLSQAESLVAQLQKK